eukprot:COSAG04_NODE_648_length_11585_cov_20.935335_13_plen_203_part_00
MAASRGFGNFAVMACRFGPLSLRISMACKPLDLLSYKSMAQVSAECWSGSPSVAAWMKDHDMNATGNQANQPGQCLNRHLMAVNRTALILAAQLTTAALLLSRARPSLLAAADQEGPVAAQPYPRRVGGRPAAAAPGRPAQGIVREYLAGAEHHRLGGANLYRLACACTNWKQPAKPAKGRRIVCLKSLMDSHKSDGLKPYE